MRNGHSSKPKPTPGGFPGTNHVKSSTLKHPRVASSHQKHVNTVFRNALQCLSNLACLWWILHRPWRLAKQIMLTMPWISWMNKKHKKNINFISTLYQSKKIKWYQISSNVRQFIHIAIHIAFENTILLRSRRYWYQRSDANPAACRVMPQQLELPNLRPEKDGQGQQVNT